MVLHHQLQDLTHHRGQGAATGATAAVACWTSLVLRSPAIHPLILMMCCSTKSKQLRIHWSNSVLSAILSPDEVFIGLPNRVYILSNQVYNTAISICSSSVFVVHNLFFILASLYTFNFFLKILIHFEPLDGTVLPVRSEDERFDLLIVLKL